MDCTDKIIGWLKENLSEEKFSHSLGTAQYARKLAREFNLDEEKAYAAGLLHDCAKCMDCTQIPCNMTEDEKINPKTHHAPAGAYVAQQKLGITDEEILGAIRCHTLGKPDMTDFEKIVFLADKVEPNTRDAAFREKIEALLKEENGLNKAIHECYRATIDSLRQRGLKICPSTIEIYNELC
jgi:predicted HD superfamily hydrolase involved in NAD metabolism